MSFFEQGGVSSYVVEKLQTVEKRFSGTADESLARLRGALPSCTASRLFTESLGLMCPGPVWLNKKALSKASSLYQVQVTSSGIICQISSLSRRDLFLPYCLIPICAGDATSAAFDELSMFLGFLRVWGIEKVINFDALMSPTEDYFDAIYFQVSIPHKQTRFPPLTSFLPPSNLEYYTFC